MNLNWRIQQAEPLKLVGKQQDMSFVDNRTAALWFSFMQDRHLISNRVGENLYSLQEYAPGFFDQFDPKRQFRKYALAPVTDFSGVPEGMVSYELQAGTYAVFLYKGDPKDAAPVFQYILGAWMIGSGYALDDRPHFELLDNRYRNNDPSSEEEIWIPVKPAISK